MISRTVAKLAPRLVVLHDHQRLPSRFFGRFTAAVLSGLRRVG